MPYTNRAAFSALLLSLSISSLPAVAADPAPAQDAPAQQAPVERAPLLTRSQEDAIALERQLPRQDLQQLQAGDESFLALWKPANTEDPQGAVILIPGAGESADGPDTIGPLRRKFPDAGWSTLSLSLPDVQDEALMPREADPAAQAGQTDARPEAEKDASAPPEPAADAQASAEAANAAAEERAKAQAERLFARIDSAVAFAQQNKARSIVLLGHSSGAYWAARYLSERHPAAVQKFVMVAAREPVDTQPSLLDMIPTFKMKTADVVYKNLLQRAATDRLQASKRNKGPGFTQIGLIDIAGNSEAEQEQLFRRVRGWVEAQ